MKSPPVAIWQPPLGDCVKINVDGDFNEGNAAGIEIILRDNDRKFLGLLIWLQIC